MPKAGNTSQKLTNPYSLLDMTQPRIGVGLRPTHYPYLEERPSTTVTWFEAISENYMDSEGRPLDMLEFMRQDFPVALHGVSLSIASADGLQPGYLQKLKRLKDESNRLSFLITSVGPESGRLIYTTFFPCRLLMRHYR